MRKISNLGWGFLLFALILSGCGKLERKGPEPVNSPPQVFFANVPPESTMYSVNPRVYWYGTDKDGYITAYQYAVIRKDTSDAWGGLEAAKDSLGRIGTDSTSWMDNTAQMNIFGEHVPVEKGHQRDVRMYAAEIETIYTPQHIFLRAVDNEGGISEIKTRMYWRNNHSPEIFIDVDSTYVENNFYCLPETTQTWKGIEIAWHGLDTLDYPELRKQPDFSYKWELWGPYADTLQLEDPNAAMVDSSLDSIAIGGRWIYDEWVLNKFHIFKNLENYPNSGYGWYQLRVWSRDDAFVNSKDSATTFFRILKPLFRYEEPSRKTILVLDHTEYGKDGGADTLSNVWPFYETALSQAGVCDSFRLYFVGGSLPSEDSLSRCDLAIVLNLGGRAGLSEDDYVKYKNYLDVGGRLWIIGLNNYMLSGSREIKYLQVFLGSYHSMLQVATEYLGLEGVFYPQYTPAELFRLEFVAAEPFGSWELPFLEMDPDKAEKLYNYQPATPADSGHDYRNFGIPHVTYEVISTRLDFNGRAPLHRRLYSFISRRGQNSEMNHKPCATTYVGPTYRTAEFTFPLNVMKDGDENVPGALEAFRKVVEWFWEDLPEP
jgi:hypothetical protein